MPWKAFMVALTCCCVAMTAVADDLPRETTPPTQALLEASLKKTGLVPAVRDGRLAVALVVLEEREFGGLGLVNGHHMFYAASLPKIAILYGAAVSLDQERFALDPRLRDDLVAMIRRSCNPCANRVLDRVGRDWLLDLLTDGPYPLYDPDQGGGLWVGKDYAKRPAHQREPLQGLSHAATAWQAARFYYLLIRGELASPERTELMLEALSSPAIAHKFVAGLEGKDVERIYRKSGTWRRHHSDSVLVVAEHGSYILVALANDGQGGDWLTRLATEVHDRLIPATP